MRNSFLPSRRATLLAGAGAFLAPLLPTRLWAVTEASASALVDQVAAEITRIINSGRGENAMIRDFDRVLGRYGDMPTISQSVLGPAARSASQSEIRAFSNAFQSYLARKYGRRFREMIGGTITVTGAQTASRYVEVITTARLQGEAPFEVRFRVWDRSGSDRFIDMLIEGISLVISERNEIGALLDRNGGSISAMTQALSRLG